MQRERKNKRVRWRVIRAYNGGWLPVVLIGEEPVLGPVQHEKSSARTLARREAKRLREAGS